MKSEFNYGKSTHDQTECHHQIVIVLKDMKCNTVTLQPLQKKTIKKTTDN